MEADMIRYLKGRTLRRMHQVASRYGKQDESVELLCHATVYLWYLGDNVEMIRRVDSTKAAS